MPNPVVVSCPAGAWTKVATSVQSGYVWILKQRTRYVQTYRLTGVAAPSDLLDSAPMTKPGMAISASVNVDVYVYCKLFAGSVRVDT